MDATTEGTPACENCGATLAGPFCAACGQAHRSPITSVRAFTAHVLDDVANLDSRLLRTAGALLFRPGRLTYEYVRGRRVRYTQPVTLYLLAAAAFFLVASFRPFLWVDTEQRQVVGALPGMMVGSSVADQKLQELEAEGVSLELFAERFVDAIQGFLPAFLVGSVAVFSLAVYGLHFRREPRYIPHAVFALHWTAFYLVVMAAARLAPAGWTAQILPLVVGVIYLSLALRRAYTQHVALSIAKAVTLLFVFLIMLAGWVAAAIAVGLAFT